MKFAVIGDPTRQSVSDFMHGWIYEQLGLDGEYKKIKVPAEGLERWVGLPTAKKLDGFNVTIPHKSTIIPYLDENQWCIVVGKKEYLRDQPRQL